MYCSIGCAASPSSVMCPLVHDGIGRRSNIGHRRSRLMKRTALRTRGTTGRKALVEFVRRAPVFEIVAPWPIAMTAEHSDLIQQRAAVDTY
jgi:hypothetical protein